MPVMSLLTVFMQNISPKFQMLARTEGRTKRQLYASPFGEHENIV